MSINKIQNMRQFERHVVDQSVLTSVSQNSDLHWERQMVLHSVTHLSITEGHLQQGQKTRCIIWLDKTRHLVGVVMDIFDNSKLIN